MNNRLILLVLGFCATAVSLAQNLYVPLLPQLQVDLHTSFYLANMTVFVFTVASALMQIAFGPIIDKKGRKAVLLPSMLLYVLASVGCSFASSIYVLLVFRILQGIGAAAVPLVAATMIGDLFEGKARANGMATYQMLLGIAPAFGPLIGGMIGSFYGYSGAFLFLAVLSVIMLLLATMVLPETIPAGNSSKKMDLKAYARIAQHKIGLAIMLLGFTLYNIFYHYIVFLPDLLTHGYQLDSKQIGWAFLILVMSSLIGNKLSGKWQARLGSVKGMLYAFLCAIFCLVLFLICSSLSLTALLLSLVPMGLSVGLSMSIPPTLLTEAFVKERATAIGLYNFVRYLGMATAPLLGSLLYLHGGPWLSFGVAGLLFALALWFAWRQLVDSGVSAVETDR